MKVNDYVMVKYEHTRSSPISAHTVHKVVEVYGDGSLLIQGFPEPLPATMFDKMVIGKLRAY